MSGPLTLSEPGLDPSPDEATPSNDVVPASLELAFTRPTIGSVLVEWGWAIALAVFCLAAVVFLDPLLAGGALLAAAATVIWRKVVFSWTTWLFVLASVIMFIPIRRFALPIPLPFALEPYRAVIALLIVAVALAALAGRKNSWRPVVWSWSIAIFLWTMLASIAVNAVELTTSNLVYGGIGNLVQLAFLLSVMITARQLIRSEQTADRLVCFIVVAGAVVGFGAVMERFVGQNLFLVLGQALQLDVLRDPSESLRAGGGRAYASSQHPIALAVLFCMLIPITFYHARFGAFPKNRITRIIASVLAIGCMGLGLLAAVSRTGVVVMAVMFVVTLLLRPKVAGIAGLAALPALALAAGLFPKLFASTFLAFLNFDELIASQKTSVGMAGQGRLADIGPALEGYVQTPFFGTGLGSRIVVGELRNADILDNQVLGTLLETGALGMIGLIALFAVPALRMLAFSLQRHVPAKLGALVFAVAISTVGYITAMFLYDAFSFMQTLLVLCVLYALAAWAMTDGLAEHRARAEQP